MSLLKIKSKKDSSVPVIKGAELEPLKLRLRENARRNLFCHRSLLKQRHAEKAAILQGVGNAADAGTRSGSRRV